MSRERSQARKAVIQALYQWQIAKHNISDIETQFRLERQNSNIDFEYFSRLLHGIPATVDKLDEKITAKVDRKMEEVNPVELSILRMGVYELIHCLDIPYRVVINEAVELTKQFGADQGHKFVNSVLDQIAAETRQVEISARKQ